MHEATRSRSAPSPWSTMGADEPEPEPVKKALPINPENPPTWKYFLPRPGVEKVGHCHGRTQEHGEKVLWFPQIGPPGSVLLFCQHQEQVRRVTDPLCHRGRPERPSP
jgi:hypothetical protein